MSISTLKDKITRFLHRGMWEQSTDPLQWWQALALGTLQRIYLTADAFVRLRLMNFASALTYSTLLSIVPLLTLIFMMSRGFGYHTLLEDEIRQNAVADPEILDLIFTFVNSYLNYTKSGIFLGFGLILLLSTLISLVRGIEASFNRIWQLTNMRGTMRMLIDYSAVIFLMPLLLIVSIGFNIYISTQLGDLATLSLVAPLTSLGLKLVPFALLTLLFMGLYLFMPNTRVRFRSALIAAITAGIAFQGLQYFYIHSQVWMTSYNAIYGSFAALPLFMLVCQLGWAICLFCAQLCYVDQNIDRYYFGKETLRLSSRVYEFFGVLIMADICRWFVAEGKRYSAETLASKHRIPLRVVNHVLSRLCQVGLLVSVKSNKDVEDTEYLPAIPMTQISIGRVITKLENEGDERLIKEVKEIPKAMQSKWEVLDTYKKRAMNNQDFGQSILDF
ncbi:MAG: YihY/virulence factor BrkB family protein [Bacteroidales bacterium]|nr:YihY/virulence factor BrkB family protein [Bacteroidales bacterium]